MKRFLKVIVLFSGILFSSHFCLAINFPEIRLTESPQEKNTTVNMQAANLIEKYLIKYNAELDSFKTKNAIKTDTTIDNTMSEIKVMIFALRKVQTDKVEKQVAEKIMNLSIARIKVINKDIKSYLKNKSIQIRQETEEKQKKYAIFVEKIRLQMNTIIKKFKNSIEKERLVSQSERKIYSHLLVLEKESIKLLGFKSIVFWDEKEMKIYLLNVLVSIKKEFLEIRKLIKEG
jgi:hypothetical protein